MGQSTSNLPADRSSLYDELPHKGAVEVYSAKTFSSSARCAFTTIKQ